MGKIQLERRFALLPRYAATRIQDGNIVERTWVWLRPLLFEEIYVTAGVSVTFAYTTDCDFGDLEVETYGR